MDELHPPRYIEESLIDFMKEYIEQKILLCPQEIELIEVQIDEMGPLIYKKHECVVENVDKLYDMANKYNVYDIFADFPISDSIVEEIKKSFKRSREFSNWIHREFRVEKDNDNNYFANDNIHYNTKIYSHEVELTLPFIVDDDKQKKFVFRTVVRFVNSAWKNSLDTYMNYFIGKNKTLY